MASAIVWKTPTGPVRIGPNRRWMKPITLRKSQMTTVTTGKITNMTMIRASST